VNMNKNSVKPVHGTKEWSSHSVNFQLGCDRGCRYCFSQCNSNRFKRATPESWRKPVIDWAKVTKNYGKMEGRIMYPTSHDCSSSNYDAYLAVLVKMLAAGNDVLVVSKPQLECIEKLCTALKAYKTHLTFRFSIGSADNKILKAWEPGASSFEERASCLELAFKKGYRAGVSCEPMLDADIGEVITKVRPFVTDTIWLGVANRLRGTIAINCPGNSSVLEMANRLIELMNEDHIRKLYAQFKDDPLIRWKDSIKKILGLERPTKSGLDV
jgi:DNA repair photolyase